MGAIYRSYEVLVEETAANHKTRKAAKTSKEFRLHHENTCRALKITHELFQDAVCYYILCLIGLVKNERENGEPINRMWEFLYSPTMLEGTEIIARQLGAKYFGQTKLGDQPTEKLLELVYAKSPTGKKLADDISSLVKIYKQIGKTATQTKKQGKGKDAKQKASLSDMAKFANNWLQRLAFPDSKQGGAKVIANNNAYWLKIADILKSAIEPTVRSDFDDAKFSAELKLDHCFNTPAKIFRGEAALKDYGKAFAVTDPDNKNSIWEKPPATVADALTRYASPKDDTTPQVKFDKEAAKLFEIGNDAARRASFAYTAASSSFKPSGTYWLCLRYKFAPSPQTRRQLYENIKKRKETDSTDALGDVRKEYGHAFPFFTNLLGLKPKIGESAVWTTFDKSAFKRAAEEVFKYTLRTDEREKLKAERKQKVDALKLEIQGDPREALMEKLLGKLGGAIGYGMRRATIGGWADLRQDFLRIAKKDSEQIDEDKLLAAIETAREGSGGGFGSGALFKELCEEEFHPLWLDRWSDMQPHHPKNFVRWWVLYGEAKEELGKIWDKEKGQAKPIAFTWPSTKNRHRKTSFRPLDFDIQVEPTPKLDLFDREAEGREIKLVQTNATPPKMKKAANVESDTAVKLTDDAGNPLYPLTISYRRFKRDRIANAEGNTVEAEFAPPLVAVNGKETLSFHKPGNKKPLESSASLLPADKDGCWHFMFSFKLEPEMQKKLVGDVVKIDGEKSIRIVKKSGKWIGLNFRWPIDAKTEKKKTEEVAPTIGNEIEEVDAKFNPKKIWCADKFEPFHILSVDLGVRYAGAWCRGLVKIGRDSDRPNQRTISSAEHPQEIVFDAHDFGTFRLQGEDAKIWRKDKHKGFGDAPELEKCGSRGRIASEIERAEFAQLAGTVFAATKRFPIPDDPADLKFFPDLGGHLVYRLSRLLGRIRFLFKLRWQISGTKKKIGHEYKVLTGDELKQFRGEQRFNAIVSLAFIPKEDKPDETEENFMRELRLTLATDEIWSMQTYKHDGESYPLFSKVKSGHSKEEKGKAKKRKDAQKAAQSDLKKELASNNTNKWNWNALAKAADNELQNIMRTFAGENSLIGQVAHFVWPLENKRWKWNNCTHDKDGNIVQSFLERDENSSTPKRFIHGMRGLNMKRICLMQDFRQCCQSLAKLERRFYTEKDNGIEPSPVKLGDRNHEPAQAFIDKINELRDQRVNQTAHMILAEALGLELMSPAEVSIDGKSKWELKSERDLHGRYKQKKPRVAAIVLEDLSRYRTSQDRSRYENSQLMEWSHRAIIGKLQDMAQIFRVQIITVDARFSSRFCSRTGVPGIRCAQVAKSFEKEYPWKKWKDEKDSKQQPTERAKMISLAAEKLNLCNNPKATLILPMDGGPAFFPVMPHAPNKEGLEANADIGAAVNIGLRPMAHPDRLDIFPVLRTEAKGDGKLEIKNWRGSLNGTAVQTVETPARKKADEENEISAEDDKGGDEELESGKHPRLFAAVEVSGNISVPIENKCRYELPMTFDGRKVTSGGVGAAKGKDYWHRVKTLCWERIRKINAQRLRALKIEPPDEWKS